MSSCRKAFTLVELLLVLAIVAIVAAIVIPNFAASMRGNRLRSAVRTIVKAGRYTRSMAVLRQSPMTLEFDIDGSKISVTGGEARDNIVRKFERVNINYVELAEGERKTDGKVAIAYKVNGRCPAYEVSVSDDISGAVIISVDELASAETKSEGSYE